jgi:isopenicillin-N N-acyltransferase like protein
MNVFKSIAMIVLGLVMVAGVGLIWGVDMFFAPHPPRAALATALLEADIQTPKSGFRKLGECYTFTRKGITACYLSGPPEVRGAALGRFFPDSVQVLEKAAFARVQKSFPNAFLRWLAIRYLTIRQSEHIGNISLSIQKEILGFVQTTENNFPQYGSYYNRILQAQAFYDLLHPLEERTTTSGLAIGLQAEKVVNQTPLLAFNLDFPAGKVWDQNQVVQLMRPEQGFAYLAVTWPGMFGVVSGMNEEGLAIALLTAHTEQPIASGVPVMLLARQVLEQAKTLAEATQIIQNAKCMVAERFLIGSGSENDFLVVEKTPEKTVVVKMQKKFVVASNYFVSPDLRDDIVNKEVRDSGPALARYNRAKELLRHYGGPMPVTRVARVLRDRRGEFGVRLGIGHPAAVNTLNSVHSVIFDLKNRKAWVARSPQLLGGYVPFSIATFDSYDKKERIAADPLLHSGKYNEYLVYQHGLQEAERLFLEGNHQESLSWLQEVNHLNPLDYRSFLLAGKALHALNRRDEARFNFRQALKLHPAYFREKQEIKQRLKELDLAGYQGKQ